MMPQAQRWPWAGQGLPSPLATRHLSAVGFGVGRPQRRLPLPRPQHLQLQQRRQHLEAPLGEPPGLLLAPLPLPAPPLLPLSPLVGWALVVASALPCLVWEAPPRPPSPMEVGWWGPGPAAPPSNSGPPPKAPVPWPLVG